MDNAKVDEVLRATAARLRERDCALIAEHFPAGADLPMDGCDFVAECHALWMCDEALTFPAEKLEKKMRWLGFIQGVLWVIGDQTIEQLKRANMPEAEK